MKMVAKLVLVVPVSVDCILRQFFQVLALQILPVVAAVLKWNQLPVRWKQRIDE